VCVFGGGVFIHILRGSAMSEQYSDDDAPVEVTVSQSRSDALGRRNNESAAANALKKKLSAKRKEIARKIQQSAEKNKRQKVSRNDTPVKAQIRQQKKDESESSEDESDDETSFPVVEDSSADEEFETFPDQLLEQVEKESQEMQGMRMLQRAAKNVKKFESDDEDEEESDQSSSLFEREQNAVTTLL
jgi:hypothetical protein